MEVTHQGSCNDWNNILVSPESRRNICSAEKLLQHGYGLSLMKTASVIRLYDMAVVWKCEKYNGMPWIPISTLLELPFCDGTNVNEVNHLTDNVTDANMLELLHARTGCTSHRKLTEAYRKNLLSKTIKTCLCKSCASRSKITRRSFKSREVITSLQYLDKVTADIGVYINCESR